MPSNTYEGSERLNISATDSSIKSSLSTGGLCLVGIFVASASNTPTIKVADSNGIIANTFTPTGPAFYRLPCQIGGTLTVTIGGTVDCTVFYGPT